MGRLRRAPRRRRAAPRGRLEAPGGGSVPAAPGALELLRRHVVVTVHLVKLDVKVRLTRGQYWLNDREVKVKRKRASVVVYIHTGTGNANLFRFLANQLRPPRPHTAT